MKRILVLALMLSGCAAPLDISGWRASEIATFEGEAVVLVDPEAGHRRLTVEAVRELLRIKRAVEEAAGPLRTELAIIADARPAAFVYLEDGRPTIGYSLGMIDLLSGDPDAAAALFGHELAHLYLEHGHRRQSRAHAQDDAAGLAGAALTLVGIPFAAVVGELASELMSRSYSREDEREADRAGLDYMARAGFDPQGAVRLQQRLAGADAGPGLSFLSTHPSGEERIEDLKRLAAERRARP